MWPFSRSSARDAPPGRDEFGEALLARLRQAGGADLTYDTELFQIRPLGDDGIVLNLENPYSEYRQATPETRDALIDQFAQAWISVQRERVPPRFAAAKQKLLPAIRHRSYLSRSALQSRIDATKPIEIPFADVNQELILTLVYQLTGAVQVITREVLGGWSAPFEDAMSAAWQNLAENARPRFASPLPGLYACEEHGPYDAALALLPGTFDDVRVAGDRLVMMPNRNTLLITGTDERDGVAAMAMLAEGELDDPRRISGTMFRACGGQLVPWLPEGDDELFRACKSLVLRTIEADYQDQGLMLAALPPGEYGDAQVSDIEIEDGRTTFERFSWCDWKEGLPALLPRAERIRFLPTNAADSFFVPWDAAHNVLGKLMEPLGLYPERYRVSAFPSNDDLDLLRLAAVD